jgi:hypothetical protein
MQESIRLTTSASVFEESCESHQLFSPGGQLFEELSSSADASLAAEAQPGICWLIRDEQEAPVALVVNTLNGLRRINTLDELVSALSSIGAPNLFPYTEWPGYRAYLIA